jgi:hypothetical protein
MEHARPVQTVFFDYRLDGPKNNGVVVLLKIRGAGSSMVEQLTLNQRVAGSSPARLTTYPLLD